MANEEDNELSNILIDDELSLDLSLDPNLSNENQATNKRSKPILKCVVCGDSAQGRIIFAFFFL
jgi:hypothetical protein